MFRKIISNLPFSPTLIGELGFYAKRLRKEEATRRIGLILTALALVVQSFLAFSPPESANAANAGDLVYGGFKGRTDMLQACHNNTQGFRDLALHADITCEILANAKFGEIHSRVNGNDAGWLSWNRTPRFSLQRGESLMTVGDQQIYVRPLAAFDIKNTTGNGSYYKAFYGKTRSGKDFAIMIDCANILLKERITNNPNIKVCDLVSQKMITIPQSAFDSKKHSRNSADCQPKPIQICELATKKMITIDERNFDARKHSKNPDDCKAPPPPPTPRPTPTPTPTPPPAPKPTPMANCSSLTVRKISRTEVELQGSATTANGATIRSYTYVIKDQSGQEVMRRTVNSTSSVHSLRHTLEKEGSYSVELIAATSLGNRESSACKGSFTIEPIARCPLNPGLPINDPNCQPCPGDPALWVKDEDCAAKIIRSKVATNLTDEAPADTVLAKASDRIEYTLTARNDGNNEATFDMEDSLIDLLDYATLYDRGGGSFDETTKLLSWQSVRLKPGEEQSRTYVIQMQSSISPMPRGTSDPTSNDCRMINTFGNSVEVDVDCPAPKIVEQVVPELPKTGPAENMIFGGVLAAIVTFLYLRTRQLDKEVRLIRREVTAGTI